MRVLSLVYNTCITLVYMYNVVYNKKIACVPRLPNGPGNIKHTVNETLYAVQRKL